MGLEKQKIKLNKDKAKARRSSESGSETKRYKSRATPPMAVSRSDKLKKLEKLKGEVDQMMLELNKDCKEYSHVSGKCVNATKGGENPSKESHNYTKTQRDTKKRKEHRNKPTKSASHQTNKEEKYLKNLSNKNLTYFQTKVISKGLKFILVNKPNTNKIQRRLLQDF